MAERPWLSIIGIGENGTEGLAPASLSALDSAEIVMAPPRHLSLLPQGPWETREWPVPFADGIAQLIALRGRQVAVLVSGDPFWYGAGSTLARHLDRGEWHAFPAPSTFSLVAAHMGWPLEQTPCIGLHAAPLTQLRPHLSPLAQLIVLLRDGHAVADLAAYLIDTGFDDTQITVFEAIGGPRARVTEQSPKEVQAGDFAHPVCVALKIRGSGTSVPLATGRPDDLFDHDGQITKRPVRALTLSALAPNPGEHLWDIGGGSGSIAIEWLLAHPAMQATTIEADTARAARIGQNATRLGVDRLRIVQGKAPDALDGLDPPDAIFVGGGLSADMLERLRTLAPGARLVANAVTLEAESLLADAQQRIGGTLLRIELSHAQPLGTKTGWRASFPIVQWSVTL